MQEEFEISDIDREEADYVIELIKKISKQEESAMLCTSDSSNPNCFSITYANKAFLNLFNVEHFLVVGKDFDFLFKDIDLNCESLQYHEYAKLIKAVKNFKFCSAIIDIKETIITLIIVKNMICASICIYLLHLLIYFS